MDTTSLFCPALKRRIGTAPDAVAVEFRDRRLSYAALSARADGLAAELARRGVRRGDLVGIAASPSLELPVAVLGILRAGAAWLPLDPGYPPDRLRYMIDDSGIGLVLAGPDSPIGAVIGDSGTARTRRLEMLDPATVPLGGRAPEPDLVAEDLAYVIYTSGSTGRPKGVALTHGGLANMAAAQVEAFGVTPADRVLQFAPISFDASVFEMVMALYAGGTLVLAPREDIPPGPGLADFLKERRITRLTLPPSVLATLPYTELPDLGGLVCAGEALPEPLAERWLSGRRMFNAYGPTETTVWATVAELSPGGGKPSIGTAIRGATALVLDERLRPVPDGAPGELAIGGAGVGRGYLGRPGLTAERFVPDPDPARPGGRLYLTGDRVVRRPDGNLEFLGRLDHQVKIRGFRIEPDEVARRLAEFPGVTDAVVIARDLGAGTELAGYVTGAGLDVARLRAHLAERLPAYMVPAALVRLETMPLTPSGKIDRAALPAPGKPDTGWPGTSWPGTAGSDHVEPATPAERALAAILADLLGVERLGATDDFFALGGHSLLAGRLAARVRTELGKELPLRRIYDSPTIAGMARSIDGAGPAITVPPIRPAEGSERDEPAPLSFPQERIWFLEDLSPGNLAYNAQATLRLEGPLDAEALRRTLTEIVRRQEIFRTAFRSVGGTPVQVTRAPMPIPLPVVDVSGLPGDEREQRAEEAVAEAMREPFDLGAPPLARWTLIKHSERDHSLVHVEHHLVHDGWSYALFLSELREIYAAYAAGRPSPLPEPEVRYADFARWQREWMSGDVLKAHLEHWTGELAGAPPALELPTDRPRPPVQTFDGSAVRVDIPADLCRRLREYGRARGVTLYATMLAGFAALMSRYGGGPDVVVGSGVANRRLAEIERMMGMVVNTLPLRIDLSGDPWFGELTRRTHAAVARAHEWQDVPLDRLVEALAPPRDASRNPLFQVMFSFHDSRLPDLDFAGLRGTVLERHNRSAKTDINVVVLPRAEQRAGHGAGDDAAPITLIWEYATALFDAGTMRAMVERYLTLLDAALSDPDGVPFDRLPLLTGDASAQVIAASHGPATPFPADRTIPELFAERVAERPEAVALVDGDRTRTYAELDAETDRLAHLLRARGVGRDVPVGVLLRRGDEMIKVLLAVLKAGGAYVPLDPGYPSERLAWMLADVGAPVVVTRDGLSDRVDTGSAQVVHLDRMEAELADVVAERPPRPAAAARPDSLAYILFTSGSTGRPKGVMVEHRSVLRLVCGADYVDFGPGERFAQVADASFDAFTFEMWGALLHGGALCVIPSEELLTEGGLGRALKANAVTSMFLTSALFSEVMTGHPDSFAGMTNLLVGGDVLNVTRVRALAASGPERRPARLLNGYGPTETTTFAVCGLIESVPPDAVSVPIGRPIANTSGHVLDRWLRPVPAGVPGELFIGGPGVARGYANRPALTAERFLPDPFAGGGARMYRTGDIARYLPDGTIEFLGRADGQVKIRGFRIEPGEVEAALTAHSGVAQAVVIVDEPPSGRRLVAYVVPDAAGSVAEGEIRAHLAERLPPYLLPGAIVRLPGLPLTASGKVDRAALPPVPDDRPAGEAERVPPRTGTERELAELAAGMLGVRELGVTDDFFVLGGHSLLAMRLVARTNERYAATVPLRDFLHAPTVARLAAVADATRGAAVPERAGPSPFADTDQDLLDRLDDLSDDEVDALLRDMSVEDSPEAEGEVER
ncbi:amino acid adenylation domain-containing protein [Actinomadura sp. 9N407]|uniref:amino acid adenylation domain-containing protein n=1 Tax=Actinomadura sp. 9N407 TaxID=3375154 RepID=UPI0037B3A710